jgi:hypothetical protein
MAFVASTIAYPYASDLIFAFPSQSREQVSLDVVDQYLCSIRVVCRLFIIQTYCLGVEIDSCRPVMGSECFVAFILEGNRLHLGGGHFEIGSRYLELGIAVE